MRITYRSRDVKDYWVARWEDIPADDPMANPASYPLKYAEMVVDSREGRILEAGCGAGRILRYYHERGYDIVGIDYVELAIEKLAAVDASLQVEVGDITNLRFADGAFRSVLAFGLYHSLQEGLEKAVQETYRVLKEGGRVCASFRADNLQTRFNDWLVSRKRGSDSGPKMFHKRNLTQAEFTTLFGRAGFEVMAVYPVENMPVLYKWAFFRAVGHKVFDESKGRREGYRLSRLGRLLQAFLMRFFPSQFCNVYVIIARKPRL